MCAAKVYTNTVEGYYSIFKRGMKGVYQHCGEKHLHRYLSEFDFRYSNRVALRIDDSERAFRALKGTEGKRLNLSTASLVLVSSMANARAFLRWRKRE